MVNKESALGEAHGPHATQCPPTTPKRKVQPGIDMSRVSSSSAYDSFFTADDNDSRISSDASRSIRKTRSAARNSSILASSSSNNLGTSSPVSSTPFRGRAELSAKSSGTPHLDHVLSFHQAVSPPTFSHDVFTSFALDSDIPDSHDSVYSYFGNWRFYSSGLGNAGGEVPPNSSEDASLDDSDSSEEGHQVILLPRPHSLQSVARSEPHLSSENTTLSKEDETGKPYVISRKRSKSLSALPTGSIGPSCRRSSTAPSGSSRHDHLRAFSMNSSSEAMHFACRSSEVLDGDSEESSFTTFELVENLEKYARNGKRTILRRKFISKPIAKLQKVVHRLLA